LAQLFSARLTIEEGSLLLDVICTLAAVDFGLIKNGKMLRRLK